MENTSSIDPHPLCLTPWISSSSLKTSQDFCPGDFFSPLRGEEGVWEHLEAAECPMQMQWAGGSAELLEEGAGIMKGRKGKQRQG